MSKASPGIFPRYVGPAIAGAGMVFAIRWLFADLATALIGIGVFVVCLVATATLAHVLHWQHAPVHYVVIAIIAATTAFVFTRTDT